MVVPYCGFLPLLHEILERFNPDPRLLLCALAVLHR